MLGLGVKNLVRSKTGRAFAAIRDRDIAAEALGINLFKFKATALAISCFYGGVAGALLTTTFGGVEPGTFNLLYSILFIAIVIIGGAGTVGMTLNGEFYDTGSATYQVASGTIDVDRGADGTTEFGISNAGLSFTGGNVSLANGTNLSISTGNGAVSVPGIRANSSETVGISSTGNISIGTGGIGSANQINNVCLLYTSPSPRDRTRSRMPASA